MRRPAGVRNRIIEAVRNVEGVLEVDRVRIRRAGNRYFADFSVGMSRNVTFQKSERVANEVYCRIRGLLPDADVVVQRRGPGQSPEKSSTDSSRSHTK